MVKFIQESYSELSKVKWPTRAQIIRLTQYVIGVSLIVGVYVAVLDYIFKAGLEFIIK